MSKNDQEAVLVLGMFFILMLFVGMMTALLGDWLWGVFGRLTTGSRAAMWLAHATALGINLGIVWSVLCRLVGDKRWPWEGDQSE
jgi:hypothetical protein